MGELQNDLAVKIGNRVGAVSKFSVDKKQVIAGAIDVVQTEIHAQTSLLLLYWSTVLVNHFRLNAKLKVLFI